MIKNEMNKSDVNLLIKRARDGIVDFKSDLMSSTVYHLKMHCYDATVSWVNPSTNVIKNAIYDLNVVEELFLSGSWVEYVTESCDEIEITKTRVSNQFIIDLIKNKHCIFITDGVAFQCIRHGEDVIVFYVEIHENNKPFTIPLIKAIDYITSGSWIKS
jgi:hypothetical protein